jgi:hypothetical protein
VHHCQILEEEGVCLRSKTNIETTKTSEYKKSVDILIKEEGDLLGIERKAKKKTFG